MPHEPIRYSQPSAASSRIPMVRSRFVRGGLGEPVNASHADRGYGEATRTFSDRLVLTPHSAAMLLSTIVVVLTLIMRGSVPVDETRYLTVAWEMWRSGNLLVPHLNGVPYSHKPPMMFWLINAAWALVGPQEWAARAVPAAFLPLSVFLTYRLGLELSGQALGGRAALILASMMVFAAFGSATLFDAMLTTATITGLIGLLQVARGRTVLGWLIFASSISFGILSKGPVILIHLLPVALLAPLWMTSPMRWSSWYLCLLTAITAGVALPLLWAFSAAAAGGPDFGTSLLWQQTAGRVVDSFAHKRPVWFYLPLLPLLIFPWTLSARLWTRSHGLPLWQDVIWRMPVMMIAGSVIALSLVSGKQLHYLLPALPAAALLIARKIAKDKARPVEEVAFPLLVAGAGLALLLVARVGHFLPELVPSQHAPGIVLFASAAFLYLIRKSTWQVIPLTAALIYFVLLWECHLGALSAFDVRPLAALIEPSKPVAFVGNYQGEIGFAARLTRPVETVRMEGAAAWRAAHPDGYLIAPYKVQRPDLGGEPVLDQPYGRKRIALWAPPRHG